ncbi:oligosaccharide flippase family protein [Pseudooceanicola sp. C21-150M6]|uniref:oligosaccharide flippase family protein n=1 Tax=Pseudooceanicola sp. C21-150M6 TaxID=3434355 RepID=UPI003D7F77F4
MTDQQGQSASRRGSVNAVVSMIGLSSQQLSAFVITLLAARYLTAAEYGVYTLSVVFVEFVIMLTYTGFFHFVVNSDADDTSVLSTMFWVLTGIGAIGGGLIFIFADVLANVFDAPRLAPVLRWLGALQPFASMIGWGSAALTRAGMMRRYFLCVGGSNFGALFVGILALIYWQSVFALVAFRAARIALALAMFFFSVPERPKFVFDAALARKAAGYASGLYGARLLTFFSNFGTDLILAFIFSTAESGLYRFANRLAMATVEIVAQPLRSFSLKSFGQQSRKGQSLDPVFANFFGAGTLLIGGVAATVMVLGGAVVDTMFRTEYQAAIIAVQALSIVAAARVTQSMVEPIFAARGNTRVAMYNNLGLTTMILISILIFAPQGFQTLAIAQAVLQVLSVPITLLVIRRWGRIDIGPGLKRGGKAIVLVAIYAVALAGFYLLVSQSGLTEAWALIASIGFAVVFGLSLAFVGLKWRVLNLSIFSD